MFSKLYREKKIMCYWLLSYTHDSDQFRQKYFKVDGFSYIWYIFLFYLKI